MRWVGRVMMEDGLLCINCKIIIQIDVRKLSQNVSKEVSKKDRLRQKDPPK